jgi:hypothetical protein
MKKKVIKKKPKVEYLPLDITIGPYEQFALDFGDDFEIKCECGAEKCKTTHSTWCPKHKS